MTIDPGVEMGYAIWDLDGLRGPQKFPAGMEWRAITVKRSGYLRGKTGKYSNRLDSTVAQFLALFRECPCEIVVSEFPEVWGSSGRGGAANASGDLLKLAGFCYAARQAILDHFSGVQWEFVPVSKWKGQTPKELTQMRIKRAWNWKGQNHNEADAVGIGDWVIRKAGYRWLRLLQIGNSGGM